MNLIAELLELGARELVAVLAEESIKQKASGLPWPGRSAMSRGIAMIRKLHPVLTAGQKGYEAARNIFRMQERRAASAAKAMAESHAPPYEPPDSTPPRRNPRPVRDSVFTLRVETLSQRAGRSEWIIVRVNAPGNSTLEDLRALARQAVTDRINAYDPTDPRSGRIGPRARIGEVIWIG